MASSESKSARVAQGDKKKKHHFNRPPMTDEYQVESSDTLFSIAVAVGCTTAELRRLNRLQTSLLFPGQVLFVPAHEGRRPPAQSTQPLSTSTSPNRQAVPNPEEARPTAVAEAAVELAGEALDDDGDPISVQDSSHGSRPMTTLQCRYVTSNGEGIVHGTLTVSSLYLNFQPDLSNRLVVERGPERYSVHLSLNLVTSLGMYDNAGQMSISDPPTPSGSLTSKHSSFLFCSSAEWERSIKDSPVPVSKALTPSHVPVAGVEVARNALSNSPSPPRRSSNSSSPLPPELSTVAQATENESTDVTAADRAQPISLPVTIDAKSSRDKKRQQRSSDSASHLPRYLCVRTQSLLPQLQDTSENKPEFWFALPTDEIAPLHNFLEEHCSLLQPVEHNQLKELIGSFVLISSFAIEEGLDIVEDFFSSSEAKGCYLTPVATPKGQAITEGDCKSTRSVAEVAQSTIKDVPSRDSPQPYGRRQSVLDLPTMNDKSEIMSFEHLCRLQRHLPNSVVGCAWELAYSTSVHGFSLRTMYRNMRDMDGPILLTVRDQDQHVFGCMSSTQFRVCDKFIGTGQCFLYTFHKGLSLKIFTWTGENEFFVKGDMNTLSFGSGQGKFGLWLDENLYHGSSHYCQTYDNEILSGKEQFIIQSVEAWCFK